MIDFFQTVGIKRYIFIDCENAENLKTDMVYDFLCRNNYLKCDTQIFCMLGANVNQNKWYDSFIKQIDKLKIFYNITPIRISTSGDNALDNVLSVYLGLVLSHNQNAEYIIVAFDNGYYAIEEHFKGIGLQIRKEIITQDDNKIKPDVTPSVTNDSAEDEVINKILQHFTEMKTKKPQSERTLKQSISSFMKKEKYDLSHKDFIQKEVIKKLEADGKISIGKDKNIKWLSKNQNLSSTSKNDYIFDKPV